MIIGSSFMTQPTGVLTFGLSDSRTMINGKNSITGPWGFMLKGLAFRNDEIWCLTNHSWTPATGTTLLTTGWTATPFPY